MRRDAARDAGDEMELMSPRSPELRLCMDGWPGEGVPSELSPRSGMISTFYRPCMQQSIRIILLCIFSADHKTKSPVDVHPYVIEVNKTYP